MSVEDIDKVDRIGINRKTGDVHLLISDHLDWAQNEGEHLFVLQDKLNTYLEFVESGQLYAKYPRARGKRIVFEVMGKFALSEEATKFYRIVGKAVQDYGCSLQFVHYQPNEKSSPADECGPEG
jgi:hypothetical protein